MNWELLTNSLLVSGFATFLAVAAGFVAALCQGALPEGWRRFFSAGAVAALAMPPFLAASCWLELLGHTGSLRPWIPFNIYSLGGTVWVLALLHWPVTFLLVGAEWRKLQPSLLEMDLRLRGLALVRHILLPAARPSLGLAVLLTFVLALNNFAVPSLLQVKVYPAEIWVSFNTTFDFRKAVLLSWPLLAVPLLFLWWLRRSGLEWPRLQETAPPETVRRQLSAPLFAASVMAAAACVILSAGLPLGELFLSARTWRELPGAVAAGQSAVAHSFFFAFTAAVLAGVLSLGCWRWKMGGLLWTLFLTPGIVLGISLIFVFNRPGLAPFYQSLGIVILGFTARYLAICWEGTARSMQSVSRVLDDSARAEGARGWARFRHARWPQAGPRILAAGYLVYVLCLWDVETLVFIIPPGAETLSLRIFNLLHYGHNAQVNALCLALLGLAAAPMILWRAAQMMGRRQAGALVAAASVMALSGCESESANEKAIESKLFSHVQIIGTRGTGLGQFNKPRSIAVDRDDNFYVTDMTGRVQKFSPEGQFLLSWQMPETDLGKAKGMCRDSDGNIVVIEPHYSRVNHFTPDGKLAAQWGVHGTNVGNLMFPRSACALADGTLFLSEYGKVERVQRFSRQGGNLERMFGKPGSGPGEFNRAEGLGLDPQNNLFVADSCNHRIQVFNSNGDFIETFGRAGTGPGEFSYPYDVQIDPQGYEFVCEFGNSRVQILDRNHLTVEIIGRLGSAPGEFSNPWAIALDSHGNLYVADSRNHRVQKFIRREGSRLTKRSEAGKNPA